MLVPPTTENLVVGGGSLLDVTTVPPPQPRRAAIGLRRAGEYTLAEPLVLDHRDGGAEGSPVTYASFPGERAQLTGAARLPTGFHPATDAGGGGLVVAELRGIVPDAAAHGKRKLKSIYHIITG